MTTYKFRIGTHWVVPLLYADVSGLTDDEEATLDVFITSLPVQGGIWDIQSEVNEFNVDEISGLYCECVLADYVVR